MSHPASAGSGVSQLTDTRAPLPGGWRWVRLGEICQIIAGQSPPGETYRKTPSGLPFFQGKADFGERHPVARTWCIAPNKVAQPGDILISVRAPVGPTNVADVECCIGRGLAAIRPNEIADRDFILAALKYFEDSLAKLGSGSTFGAINRDVLESLEIPLPPLAEQKRIAELFGAQILAIQQARAAAEAQIKAAKVLPEKFLRAVFDSHEAGLWEKRRIGDIARVQSGYAFKSEWFTSEGIRLLRNANIFQGYISWKDTVFLSPDRRAEFKQYELNKGDIVLSLDRPFVSSGLKIARLTDNDVPALLLQRVARFQLTGEILPDYFYAFLNSPEFIKEITQHEQSLGVPHVSPKQVEAVELRLPPIEIQISIASQLAQQMEATQIMNKALKCQLDSIERLPSKLLHEAFTGQLR